MAIYKDVEPLEVVAYKGESEDFDRGVTFILEQLDALPTADVAEVKHGEWIPRTAISYDYYCSNCNGDAIEYKNSYGALEYYLTDYCYHCGSIMDGGKM